MRDVEGERLAVTFKLRSPDTALLDFHMALTAAGKQFEPRYTAVLTYCYTYTPYACHQLDHCAWLPLVHYRTSLCFYHPDSIVQEPFGACSKTTFT